METNEVTCHSNYKTLVLFAFLSSKASFNSLGASGRQAARTRLLLVNREDSGQSVSAPVTRLLDPWGESSNVSRNEVSAATGLSGLTGGGCGGWGDALELQGCGGACIKGRCFCTEGTASTFSLGNHLELLPSVPLSLKNGCNLRKLCSWQAILLESEGSLIFFSYVSSWKGTSF